MQTKTRTAPVLPAKAVGHGTRVLPQSLTRFAGDRQGATKRRQAHSDFGPISRAEMREIVAEMIG
jgi:hypothetical protein